MNIDLIKNIKSRHILAQEGQGNNIKAINHGKKKVDMIGSKNMLGKVDKAFY